MSEQRTGTSPSAQEVLASLSATVTRQTEALQRQRLELIEVQSALVAMRTLTDDSLAGERGGVAIPEEHLAAQIETLFERASLVRNAVLSVEVGPGLEEPLIRQVQAQIRGGLELRSLYPVNALESDAGRRWIRTWGAAGEIQRVVLHPPSEFNVYDEEAVVAAVSWDDLSAGYRLIRDPALVRAYAALFDATFAAGTPVPRADLAADEQTRRLLHLLDAGMKDEAIARILGLGLRTVRRRIASLMLEYGVETRFQLGAVAALHGLLPARRSLTGDRR